MGGQWLASVGKLLVSWCLAAICVPIRCYQQKIDPIDSIHIMYMAILCDLFGMVSSRGPFKGSAGDQKVKLNHLVRNMYIICRYVVFLYLH